jgi:hypothetical protein
VIRINLETIEEKRAGWNSENPESPVLCPDTPATPSGVSGQSIRCLRASNFKPYLQEIERFDHGI